MSAVALSDIVCLFERQFTATTVSVSRKVNNQKDDEEAQALPRRQLRCVVIVPAYQA
jgi:hypothetical protein